jgi:hypothetical protein
MQLHSDPDPVTEPVSIFNMQRPDPLDRRPYRLDVDGH